MSVFKSLNITKELYCDAGIHTGEYKVTISGYLTPQELAEVRAAMATRVGTPEFSDRQKRYEKVAGILGIGIPPEMFGALERAFRC